MTFYRPISQSAPGAICVRRADESVAWLALYDPASATAVAVLAEMADFHVHITLEESCEGLDDGYRMHRESTRTEDISSDRIVILDGRFAGYVKDRLHETRFDSQSICGVWIEVCGKAVQTRLKNVSWCAEGRYEYQRLDIETEQIRFKLDES